MNQPAEETVKIVVVYTSLSGFTAAYAKWIAEEVSADLFTLEEISVGLLQNYSVVVYGGSLHMVGITGYKRLQKYLLQLPDKKLVLFTTGASPQRDETVEEVRNANLSAEEQKTIPFFYFRGGFNYDRLDLLNKILMTLLKWKLKLIRNKTPDMLGMLNVYDHPMDFTRRDAIAQLVEVVKHLSVSGPGNAA